jgi:hypothetical protein
MGNAYKRLGGVRPASTAEAKLYGPAAATSAVVSVNICNQDATARTFRIALTYTAAAADTEDWIADDMTIEPNSMHQISGIALVNPNTIRVRASIADLVSFVAHGMEIT